MIALIQKMTEDLRSKVRLMVGRAILLAIGDAGAIQTAQAALLADETHDDMERVQEYGFTSVPLPGAEAVAVFPGGNRDHGLIIAVEDRRYRLRGLAGGEVALYDDQGQKVHLTRDGIVIYTEKTCRVDARDIVLHASKSYSWDVNGYGQRITWLSGTTWEIKTWQTGATIVPVSLSINPPEGP